ncbi:MAG: hydrolase or acyltransferase (alpha/beta hydrolase superfamily)-like protein, partial [Actinomycetia bacterium]|nr:hydrolase or acyltransferase (alpha/beta hydrolase superfamily)-like protein [Actinomycetes bacterium]
PRGWSMIKMLPDSVLAKAKSERALHRLLRRLNNGEPMQQPLLDLCVAGLRTFRLEQPFPKRMSDTALASIRTPTLLLFGDASPVNHAAQAARRARRLLPDVQSEVVADGGHMLPIENPELFTGRVLGFICEVDGRAS